MHKKLARAGLWGARISDSTLELRLLCGGIHGAFLAWVVAEGAAVSARVSHPSHGHGRGRRGARAPLKVVLDFAEITDRKRIKDRQILLKHVVDLVLGVARNEQHPSRLDGMHHVLNGHGSTS